MKTILQLIILIFLASVCKAQDLIILKDGNEINAKVIEVNLADIKYKKFDNPEGPSYSVQKSGVFMIKYKNGTKDIINTVKETDNTVNETAQKNKSSNSSIPNQGLTANGNVELGGDIGFFSRSVSGSNSSNVFSFNPYFGFMIENGFELALIPGITSSGSSGSNSTTEFNIFLAPTYNINVGKAYPFFEFLVGYNSVGQGNSSLSGVGVGGSGGVKVQIGANGALVFALRYLNKSYGSSTRINTLSMEIGARIFIFKK